MIKNFNIKSFGKALRSVLSLMVLFMGLFSLRAHAQERNSNNPEYKIYFQFDKSAVNSAYMSNAQSLSSLDSLVAAVGLESVESVKVVSYSSPEGNYAYNLALSKKRTDAVYHMLVATYPSLAGKIELDHQGEAWQDLRNSVVADANFTEDVRSQILEIIDSDRDPSSKEAALKALPQYKRLYSSYFRKFRYAEIRLRIANSEEIVLPEENKQISSPEVVVLPPVQDTVVLEEPELIIPEHDTLHVEPIVVDTVAAPVNIPPFIPLPAETTPAAPVKKTFAAVKTNLLYDAVTALNFEVEIPVAGRWSIMAEDVFPWWHIDNKYAFQMWEMGVEARFWFKPWDVNGTEKMRGWFVGAYGMSSKYDFQYDRSINYQGEYWSAGITAGYVMPIGRKQKLNLEFSISAGYLQTDYRHYMPAEDYSVLIRDPYNMGTVSYFGPTKAKVSLIVPINFGKKGGAR